MVRKCWLEALLNVRLWEALSLVVATPDTLYEIDAKGKILILKEVNENLTGLIGC